jgi:hypothetical protein
MKRLLLSVFAAAITAAFVIPAPATAGDITLSGQYRLRGEFRDKGTFTKNDSQSSDYLQRVRLTADAEVSDDVSARITIQDTKKWGDGTVGDSGPSLIDGDNSSSLDLQEAYLSINNLLGQPVSLKAGTQVINLGDQRLVGAFGWDNRTRSFDALRFDHKSDAFDLLFVSSKINENGDDNDQDFYILQGTIKTIPDNTLEVYAMLLRDGNGGVGNAFIGNNTAAAIDPNGTQTLWTYGFRLKGAFSGVDYTLEVPFQSGEINQSAGATNYDIDAMAYAIRLGYKVPTSMDLKVGFEYAHADGDSNNADNKIETFSNLFPTNHGHFGISDRQGWRNMDAWSINAATKVNDKLSLKVAYWAFSLAEEKDALYGAANWNTSSSLVGANSANTKDEVGSEIDIVANYKLNSAVKAQLGLSRYFTGDFIDQQVTSALVEDQDFAYLQLISNF